MRRTVLLLLLSVLSALTAAAGPRLLRLDMTVQLADNGDAYITEHRQMQIDGEGTECYIVIGNFDKDSRVDDLRVSDEQGVDYTNVGDWDVDLSRAAKARRCGIVSKRNCYELCWGLGDEGSRTYTVSYVITNVVRSYSDADGFNFMFVAMNIKPHPEQATITFERKDGKRLAQDATKMWAFRYHGDINWVNGRVVARADDGISGDEAMICMLRFDKGVFHPAVSEDSKFSSLKDKAFEGSYYEEESDIDFQAILILLLFFVVLPLALVAYVVYVWWMKRKATQDLLWYRDLPFAGDLMRTNQVMNAYRYFGNDYKNLVSALVLRLLAMGALRIEEHDVQPTGIKKMLGASAKRMKLIAIYPLIENSKVKNMTQLKRLHAIFLKASGDDAILQPDELTQWMKEHTSEVEPFVKSLRQNRSISSCNNDLTNTRAVFGMKKFLQDFTLANERHVAEVALWKEYLIYAELFGIAKQVRKDMKQINPEYLNMDEALRQVADEDNTYLLTTYTLSGFHQFEKTQAAEAARGSGGSASFGGGGGFSGGGSGGGVR